MNWFAKNHEQKVIQPLHCTYAATNTTSTPRLAMILTSDFLHLLRGSHTLMSVRERVLDPHMFFDNYDRLQCGSSSDPTLLFLLQFFSASSLPSTLCHCRSFHWRGPSGKVTITDVISLRGWIGILFLYILHHWRRRRVLISIEVVL